MQDRASFLFPITDEIAAVARKLVDDPGVPKSVVTELRILLRRYDHAEASWILASTPEDPTQPRVPATTDLLVLAEVPIDSTPLPPPLPPVVKPPRKFKSHPWYGHKAKPRP